VNCVAILLVSLLGDTRLFGIVIMSFTALTMSHISSQVSDRLQAGISK